MICGSGGSKSRLAKAAGAEPLPFVTTPLHHHFPSSPLPFVTTSLLHHFPSSPLPFVTTPLHHHFPSSPLPFVTTPLHHHFPSSPLPFVITTLPPCNVLYSTTTLHHFLFVRNSEVSTSQLPLTSAQDRRTLSTAQSCLDSLRIRIEAQVNTIEETVKRKQVALALHLRQETAEAPGLLAELLAKRKPCRPFQTSTRSCPTTQDNDGEKTN